MRGGTAMFRNKEFEEIRSVYCKPVLWTASYFVTSCGGVTIETLHTYV